MRFLVLLGRGVVVSFCLLWPWAMMALGFDRVARDGVDTAFVVGSVYFLVMGSGFALLFKNWMTEYANAHYPKRAP